MRCRKLGQGTSMNARGNLSSEKQVLSKKALVTLYLSMTRAIHGPLFHWSCRSRRSRSTLAKISALCHASSRCCCNFSSSASFARRRLSASATSARFACAFSPAASCRPNCFSLSRSLARFFSIHPSVLRRRLSGPRVHREFRPAKDWVPEMDLVLVLLARC